MAILLNLFESILVLSLVFIPLYLFGLFLRPVTRRLFGMRWQAGFLTLLTLLLVLPIPLLINIVRSWLPISMPVSIPASQPMGTQVSDWIANFVQVPAESVVYNVDSTGQVLQALWKLLPLAWVLGVVFFGIRLCWQYWRMNRWIAEDCKKITDLRILARVTLCREKLKIKGNVQSFWVQGDFSPMLVGFFRPKLLLPKGMKLSDAQLDFVLGHELMHCQRKDLFKKLLANVAICLFWFHPLVWLLARQLDCDCDLACDEMVAQRLDGEERREYGLTILTVMEQVIDKQDGICVALCSAKQDLKRRLTMILKAKQPNRVKKIVSVLVAVVLCSAGLVLAVALTPEQERDVPPAQPGSIDSSSSSAAAAGGQQQENEEEPEILDEEEPKGENYLEEETALPELQGQETIKEVAQGTSTYAMPFPTYAVTLNYGWILNNTDFHTGIDLVPVKDGKLEEKAEILSISSGKVVKTGEDPASPKGIFMVVEASDGNLISYEHCSELLVSEGDTVEAGQAIAILGSTGYATGPHLHLSIANSGGMALNPANFCPITIQ